MAADDTAIDPKHFRRSGRYFPPHPNGDVNIGVDLSKAGYTGVRVIHCLGVDEATKTIHLELHDGSNT